MEFNKQTLLILVILLFDKMAVSITGTSIAKTRLKGLYFIILLYILVHYNKHELRLHKSSGITRHFVVLLSKTYFIVTHLKYFCFSFDVIELKFLVYMFTKSFYLDVIFLMAFWKFTKKIITVTHFILEK